MNDKFSKGGTGEYPVYYEGGSSEYEMYEGLGYGSGPHTTILNGQSHTVYRDIGRGINFITTPEGDRIVTDLVNGTVGGFVSDIGEGGERAFDSLVEQDDPWWAFEQ